ncbi:TPA: hypothetical protein ACKRGM_002244 [Proteus mirabilis]
MMIENKKGKINHFILKCQLLKFTGHYADSDYMESIASEILDKYDIYEKKQYRETTLIQRINHIWVIPIFMICIIPQWLITGNTGVRSSSKVGKLVNWLIGRP